MSEPKPEDFDELNDVIANLRRLAQQEAEALGEDASEKAPYLRSFNTLQLTVGDKVEGQDGSEQETGAPDPSSNAFVRMLANRREAQKPQAAEPQKAKQDKPERGKTDRFKDHAPLPHPDRPVAIAGRKPRKARMAFSSVTDYAQSLTDRLTEDQVRSLVQNVLADAAGSGDGDDRLGALLRELIRTEVDKTASPDQA